MIRTFAMGWLAAMAVLASGCAMFGPRARLATPADRAQWRVGGNWQWQEGGLTGTGDNTWQYVETGRPSWTDYQLEATLRIDTPATRRAPISEAGSWVWANYRNNHDIGGYETGLVLRRQGDDFYRLMVSVPFQEVMLWSTRGGILQVAPCALEAGQAYRLAATAQGPRLTFAIDGKTVIDYVDRTVPLLTGSVGLGLQEGTVSYSEVAVSPLPRLREEPPPHQPALSFREWKGQRWAWDGGEPIFQLGADCMGHELKLVPGYRAQLALNWYWINYGDETFYTNKQQEVKVLAEGTELRFQVIAIDRGDKPWLSSRVTVTVTYDAAAHRYVYDHVSELIVPDGHTLRLNHPIEFTDPVIHGIVGSASPATVEWPTPHPWSVYRHESGALYKHPHNHCTWYPGFGTPSAHEARANYLAPDGFWALVSDPVANPVCSIQGSSVPGSVFYTELCGWAYDLHMRWYPVKNGGVIQPGTWTVAWRMTNASGVEGDAWLAEAGYAGAGDLNAELLLYTGGIGHVETFDKVVPHASPFNEYALGPASLLDRTVGHGDSTSIRLNGPESAGSMVGGSVYSDRVEPGVRYEVSAWVKTRDAAGEGPGLVFGGQTWVSRLTGTADWQRIGFVCTPNPPHHTVSFSLFNSGSGTVWFDDFLIRPLADGEQAQPPIAAEPAPLLPPDAAPGPRLAWTADSPAGDAARTLLDRTGAGNHGRLTGTASLIDDGGVPAIRLAGDEGYVTGGHLGFAPPQTFAIWVKPGQLVNDWNMIAVGGAWNRAWTLFLFYKTAPYSIDFRPWGKRIFVDQAVPLDTWTHLAVVDDGKQVTLYVNGAKVKEDASTGKDWAALPGPLTLGTHLRYDVPTNRFIGSLSTAEYWNEALSPAAIEGLFKQGRR